jgi:hypothetical protein
MYPSCECVQLSCQQIMAQKALKNGIHGEIVGSIATNSMCSLTIGGKN